MTDSFFLENLAVDYMNGFVDWEKTSLKPYIDLLDKHALSLMEEVRKEKRKTGNLNLSIKNRRVN